MECGNEWEVDGRDLPLYVFTMMMRWTRSERGRQHVVPSHGANFIQALSLSSPGATIVAPSL